MSEHSTQTDADGENPFATCPVAQAFEEIGSKWRLVVLHCLLENGERRFSELQEKTPADSATLSRVLKELEDRGLISRRLEDRPIATYYDVTEKGEALATLFGDIEEWADEWTAADTEDVESLP